MAKAKLANPSKPYHMNWKHYLLSALAGALSVFAFAPFDLFPVAFLTLAGLGYLIRTATPKQAAGLGFCFGLGMYLFGVSWVYVSLSTYGGMPLWMGSIAVLGFAAILAVFSGLPTFVASLLADRKPNRVLLLLPFTWVVFEWCKSWVLTGFPWLDIGYTQTQSWLFAWAPIGGIYLISFIVVTVSMLLLQCVLNRSTKLGLSFGSVTLAIFICSYGLDFIRWTKPVGEPQVVGVVQANIAIEEKWLQRNQRRTIDQYQSLSAELAGSRSAQTSSADLIVWPETALPLYASQTDQAFWQTISPPNTAVLAGLLDYDGENSYNAAVLSCAESRGEPQLYRKRHLVPFGEYQPLKFLFAWVFEYLNLPMSDFAGWRGQQPLTCDGGINIGLSICYEDAFSNEYRQHLGDATVLINISEDAWFGDSFAPHQRRQLAQMRARELGRPLVRAANSGPSLFIDAQGVMANATPQFEVAIAKHAVQPMTGRTPFVVLGSWVVWLSLAVLIFLRIWGIKK